MTTATATMVYEFRAGFPVRGMDAQAVGDELNRLYEKHGMLQPEVVVAAATRPRSPMHAAFEWDDVTAAEKYRQTQARALIAAVVIVEPDGPQVRRFVHVNHIEAADDSGYMTLAAAMADRRYRGQVLSTAKGELTAFARKYRALEELARVVEIIDEVVAE